MIKHNSLDKHHDSACLLAYIKPTVNGWRRRFIWMAIVQVRNDKVPFNGPGEIMNNTIKDTAAHVGHPSRRQSN